jgi:hypothetical protein
LSIVLRIEINVIKTAKTQEYGYSLRKDVGIIRHAVLSGVFYPYYLLIDATTNYDYAFPNTFASKVNDMCQSFCEMV